MKNFQLFRYLSKGRYFIVLFALLGTVFIYFYANSNQSYSASCVIRYDNPSIEKGLNPDGSPLDVNELVASAVVYDAIDRLSIGMSTEQIRAGFNIYPIIPADEYTRKTAILDKGEAYTYFPSLYQISYTAGSNSSRRFVSDVLETVLDSYYKYYTAHHVNSLYLPDTSTADGYDYLTKIKILENAALDLHDQLTKLAEAQPGFRSVKTGYAFGDLADIYDYLAETELLPLHAAILNGHYTKDAELLIRDLDSQAEVVSQSIANRQQQADALLLLIDDYTSQPLNEAQNVSTTTANVIDGRSASETTYDTLLLDYIRLLNEISDLQLDLDDIQSTASGYRRLGTKANPSSDIEERLAQLTVAFGNYRTLTENTLNEYTGTLAASYVAPMTNIQTGESVNVKLYLVLGIVMFLCIGCGGCVVVGRLGDFVSYHLYTDKKTGVANRQRVDMVIDDYAAQPLPDAFACISIKLDTLSNTNENGGIGAGDRLLESFGRILAFTASSFGFVGHNGAGQFLAFFEDCPAGKAELFKTQLMNNVTEFNATHDELSLRCTVAYTISTDEALYEIRPLLKKAITMQKPGKQS